MAVSTQNASGQINITNETIALVAGNAASECYGVVALMGNKVADNFSELFKKDPKTSGVKVITIDNRIQIDLFIVLKYGVSMSAVCESLKDSVKYNVENFTGMIVDSVNINVIGVKV